MPPDPDTHVRDRETIETLLDNLWDREQPETPESERGPYGIDEAGVRHNAKIDVLETVLDETNLSYLTVYDKYRELLDTGFTLDRQGAIAKVRTDAKRETLRWVLNDPEPTDPRTISERLDHISKEIIRLEDDFHQNNRSLTHEHDHDIDTSVAAAVLSNAFHTITSLETYVRDGDVPDTFEENNN